MVMHGNSNNNEIVIIIVIIILVTVIVIVTTIENTLIAEIPLVAFGTDASIAVLIKVGFTGGIAC